MSESWQGVHDWGALTRAQIAAARDAGAPFVMPGLVPGIHSSTVPRGVPGTTPGTSPGASMTKGACPP